jgi:hypothetical protein
MAQAGSSSGNTPAGSALATWEERRHDVGRFPIYLHTASLNRTPPFGSRRETNTRLLSEFTCPTLRRTLVACLPTAADGLQ